MFGFEMYKVIFEVYIENQLANRQIMQAPKEMLMIDFIQTADQIKDDPRPMKIKMIRQEPSWDNFEKKEIMLNYEIEISNHAMVAWQGE
jgi:hypothetical protein